MEPFHSIVKFNAMQWYYIDIEGQQHGPVFSKLLVHKLKEGDIDGLTLVYGGDASTATEWKKISEIEVLKKEMAKIAEEEENTRLAFLKTEKDYEQENQVFVADVIPPNTMHYGDDGMSAGVLQSSSRAAAGGAASTTDGDGEDVRTYVADNGKKYVWDEEENGWVEAEEEDSDSAKDGNNSSSKASTATAIADKKRKLQTMQKSANKSDVKGAEVNSDEEEDDDEDTAMESGEDGEGKNTIKTTESASTEVKPKKKKRSKKKAKKGPNTWVYIAGLPADVTADEIKEHFSKVIFLL